MGHIESFGGSQVPVNDKALAKVAELLAEVQPDSMVHRFVLLVEAIDSEDRWISAFTMPGQKQWDTLGLLAWASALEANGVGRCVPEDGDAD